MPALLSRDVPLHHHYAQGWHVQWDSVLTHAERSITECNGESDGEQSQCWPRKVKMARVQKRCDDRTFAVCRVPCAFPVPYPLSPETLYYLRRRITAERQQKRNTIDASEVSNLNKGGILILGVAKNPP